MSSKRSEQALLVGLGAGLGFSAALVVNYLKKTSAKGVVRTPHAHGGGAASYWHPAFTHAYARAHSSIVFQPSVFWIRVATRIPMCVWWPCHAPPPVPVAVPVPVPVPVHELCMRMAAWSTIYKYTTRRS